MKKSLLILLIIVAGTHCRTATTADYYLTINGNGKVIKTEIAATEDARIQGLMHRTFLPPDTGMLFVYPDEKIRSFWMQNTHIPLSIAFIKSNGVISEIRDMQPESTETIRSKEEVQYALEMTQGWFERNQVRINDTVVFSPDLKKYLGNL